MKKWGLIILSHCIIYSILLPWRCRSSCFTGSGSNHGWTVLWCNFPWLHQLMLGTNLLFLAFLWEYSKLFKGSCCKQFKGIQQSRVSSCFILGSSMLSWDATHPCASWVLNFIIHPSCWLGAGKKLYAFAQPLSSVHFFATTESCECWQFFWFLLPCREDMLVGSVILAHIFPLQIWAPIFPLQICLSRTFSWGLMMYVCGITMICACVSDLWKSVWWAVLPVCDVLIHQNRKKIK